MNSLSLSEVVELIDISVNQVRGLVKSGYVTPERGRRREMRFSFQDIVVLKTAQRLIEGDVPRRKVTRAIRALREQLPREIPPSGLRILVSADEVTVHDRTHAWEPTSGQGVLSFDLVRHQDQLRVVDRRSAEVASIAPLEDWFARALDLEERDPAAASDLYRRIITADSTYIDAYINCGRLLHQANDLVAAEALYRNAKTACDACAALNYNLGVVLEDAGRTEEAVTAYQHALQCDPDHCDSHHNLARLFELTKRSQHAIRHFNRYRALSRRRGGPLG